MNPNYFSSGIPTAQPFGYPMQNYQPLQPKQQTNAVNIEIIGPTANGAPAGAMPVYPGMSQVMQPQLPPQMQPQMMPQMPPQMPQQFMPPVQMSPIPAPVSPPPLPVMPTAMQPPMAPPPPVAMPPMAPPPLTPPMAPPPMMPVPPPPMANQPQQPPQPQEFPQQPVQGQTPISGPQPTTGSPATAPLVSAISAITPQQGQAPPSLDDQAVALKTINEFINGINNLDPATQQEVNQQLLPNDGSTFKGLAAIASSDSSTLSGTEKQKADEVRVMSLLTLANLQKYFRTEFDNQLKKENVTGIPPISLGELPAIKVEDQIIDHNFEPNPEIREAGIFALMGVVDPSNPKDLQTLKAMLQRSAKNDPDEKIKTTANEALKTIEGVGA